MPQSSHRAPSRSGNPLLPTLGIILVLALIAAGIAAVRLSGADPAAADASDPTGLVDAPTTALDASAPSDAASAGDDVTDAPASATGSAAADPTDAATEAKVERKVKARQAGLEDRLQEAAKLAREVQRRKELLNAPFDVRVGTFNVLGSQHTAPGGTRRNYAPASVRSPSQARLISRHGLEIVGMQEMQDDQTNAITAGTGLTAWPGFAWGSKETDNSILYDAGRFEFVSGDMFTIPFMGRPRPQPILKLRVRDTGREFYVVNTHPSAGHYGKYASERHYGQDVLVGILSDLKATGLPVLLTGDMNDREVFYDRVVCRGGMVSASGGSGCSSRPPQMYAVDWVVGSPEISFSDYVSDDDPAKMTDHYVVYATAHVG